MIPGGTFLKEGVPPGPLQELLRAIRAAEPPVSPQMCTLQQRDLVGCVLCTHAEFIAQDRDSTGYGVAAGDAVSNEMLAGLGVRGKGAFQSGPSPRIESTRSFRIAYLQSRRDYGRVGTYEALPKQMVAGAVDGHHVRVDVGLGVFA